ncbi:serine hydrolase [Streptomyces sp. NPDC088747]|uniref:D-alanyl-D-alanine carboxypeptidase n=1 Tax=Streptomyces sp. NPDC088747 TaxID=3365886 RepID=UPI003810CAF4
MEEASVAGESPDRSKQHESSASSGEPTTGTAAVVPGPTRGVKPASAPVDPRLAVARAATVRVDQATAVFSTRDLRDGADGAGSDAGPEGTGDGPPGDARLRAAVAAWVATADDGDAEAGEAAGETSGGPAEAAGGTNASGTSGGTGSAGERSTPGADSADVQPDAGSDGSAAGEATDADADARDDADEVSEDEVRPEVVAKAKVSSGAADAGTKGAAESGDTVSDAHAEPGGSDSDSDRRSNATSTGAEPVAVATEPSTDAEPEPGTESEARPRASAETDAKAKPKASAKTDADPEPDATPEDKAEALAEADPDPDPDPQDKVEDKRPTPKGTPRAAVTAPEDAPEDAAPQDAPKDASEDAKGAPKDAPTAAPKDAPPVDHPTAVFKAPRPPAPAPAVDQPTTMLKLGDVKPPAPAAAKAPAPAPTPAPKPETPAERTSKFVALKPLDEPGTEKPKAAPVAADGTAVVPQVGPERTTQQPLPPKPPLDLLAELTNTPPPRQTPVRTIVRRVKIWTPLVVLLAVIFAVAQAVRPLPAAALTLTADSTYTFEGGTLDLPWPGQGQSAIEVEGVGSLGTDGKQTATPIASVAKIMTAYVILQEHPLKGDAGGEKITVDQQAEDESKNVDESTAAMTKGQQFTERQMLQLLMIPSGNNAARLLARWDSDNKTFVGKMNAAAEELGMTNTTYTDPSGLEKTTVSTATDQLKLAKKVMQNPVFAGIVGMASAKIPGLDGTIYNNNDLLVKQVGVTGLKTGSSTPAGGNLVWAATKTVKGKTQTVYGAVLGQNAGTGKVWDSLQLALTNSQKLIDKVQQGLTSATVVKKGDVVGYVDDGLGGQTPVVATKDMTAVGWPGLKTKLSIGAADGETVPHTGSAGTTVGELTVGDGSDHAVKIPVALRSELAEPGFGAKLTRVA